MQPTRPASDSRKRFNPLSMELFVRIYVFHKGNNDKILARPTLIEIMATSTNQSVPLESGPATAAAARRRSARRGVSLKEPTMIALETLRAHKLRSFLTLLGVILSVSTLIVVVSMVQGDGGCEPPKPRMSGTRSRNSAESTESCGSHMQ